MSHSHATSVFTPYTRVKMNQWRPSRSTDEYSYPNVIMDLCGQYVTHMGYYRLNRRLLDAPGHGCQATEGARTASAPETLLTNEMRSYTEVHGKALSSREPCSAFCKSCL